jgi:hypothetical protein
MRVAKGTVLSVIVLLAGALLLAALHSSDSPSSSLQSMLSSKPGSRSTTAQEPNEPKTTVEGDKGLGPGVEVPRWASHRPIHFAPKNPVDAAGQAAESGSASVSSHYRPHGPLRYNGGTVQHRPRSGSKAPKPWSRLGTGANGRPSPRRPPKAKPPPSSVFPAPRSTPVRRSARRAPEKKR